MKIMFNHEDKVIVLHSDWRDGFDFYLSLRQADADVLGLSNCDWQPED